MPEPRTALVTGAGSGIGRALADALALQGWNVLATDRDADAARATADTIVQRGLSAQAECLDVTDGAAFQALVARATETGPSVDLLVNNAGVGAAGEVRDLTADSWEKVLDVNLRGTIHGIHAAYPGMVARRRGVILNIASGAGLCPRPGMVPYAASKAAVVALSTSLRAEASAHGVRVHVACPGYIATDILARSEYVGVDGQALRDRIPIRPMPAAECARRILRGVDRNQAVIPVGLGVTLEWWLYRWLPWVVHTAARTRARAFREARR